MSNFVRPATEGADPFGTARLRRGVLDAWATSPARFREDANAEEDLVLGGYRDRLIVELAQNAADAAARAGVPGRLRLTLREGVLVAANTGAPLDAAGVESLATLRASAKRDTPSIGRFGVGFAAVLSVTDEPAVVGRHGGVRWSLAEARELAADTARHSPGLGDEVRRRDGHVPVLRLPYAAEGTAPDTYDTAVILPLRDTAAADLAERLLDAVDDSLLLTLPGLQEVVVEVGDTPARTLWRRTDGHLTVVEDSRDGTTTWRTLSAHGESAPDLLADRPVEERLRPHWSLTWAVPVDTQGLPVRPRTAPVLHAPTPSDEPLGVPALLIASFPLDTIRRHAAPGPLTDFLVQRAADAYAQLLADWRPVGTGIIDLVPGPLGKGELDGALRQAVLERLPRTAFLPPAAAQGDRRGETAGPAFGVAGELYTGSAADAPGSEVLPLPGDDQGATSEVLRLPADDPGATPEVLLPEALRPRDAEIVEGAGADTVRVLAEVLPTLLPAGLERRVELRTLGVPRVPLADVIDRLAGLEKDPDWWYRLYDSLAGTDPDRLSGLPVPLADGRTTIGPRQILLPLPDTATGTDPEVLARLGLKVAHEDAAHPLLEKLGALSATPRAVLTTPQVRAAVAASLDDDDGAWDEDAPDAEELADTVLALVREAGLEPGDEPWLGALALPDEDGELVPAGELVLPGSPFASVIRADELAEVDHELAEKWGEQPLTACGVLANFALVRATDVVLDPDELEPREGDFAEPDDAGLLDAVDVWAEDVLDRFPDSPVPPVATELVAVRDLDLVDDDKWPQALALLAQPPLRDALVQPLRILLPDGTHEVVRPYTAWWLRGHPVLDGRRPAGLLAAGGDPLLHGLYDEADATGFDDEQVLRALGVRTSVSALLEEPGGAAELLERLADPDREVTPAQLHGLYGALADLDPEQVTLPDDLRAVVDGSVDVVDAADAVVVDSPDLLPFTDGTPLLPVRPTRAAELAELFQVRRLSESVTGGVDSEGAEHDVPDSVAVLLGPRTPKSYVEHDELIVDGVEIDWRLTDDGVLHASTLEGVAAGLAWAAGQWPRRFEVAALLEDPSRTAELARDRWFD
ncbi:molecular chaperone Hsp90 [Streptomyces niveiscabiei]|uniref:sacsin N-terminal ATP-binding-like domain-containing protein n=1 Tax=Streptomyces niveiscabiei TaxID=164115 RepID=UPI0029ABC692|nr:molecular chaperone Hsp90 [Streptomyces niveiscabiei]MDX3385132.1 molecular chaperone Hsp90 [Streptomyces niveiscabiei]